MKFVPLLIIAALVCVGLAAEHEQPIHAQVTEQANQAAYYPAVATYTPDALVGSIDFAELDTPYRPTPQRTQIHYANYAEYSGNYAAGYRYGYYGQGAYCQQQYACGDYGWDFPVARAGFRIATFPIRAWLAWAPIRRLFGRC